MKGARIRKNSEKIGGLIAYNDHVVAVREQPASHSSSSYLLIAA
jgi:hypothetical protein